MVAIRGANSRNAWTREEEDGHVNWGSGEVEVIPMRPLSLHKTNKPSQAKDKGQRKRTLMRQLS